MKVHVRVGNEGKIRNEGGIIAGLGIEILWNV